MTLLGKGLPVASLWWPLLVRVWVAIANCGLVFLLSRFNIKIMMIIVIIQCFWCRQILLMLMVVITKVIVEEGCFLSRSSIEGLKVWPPTDEKALLPWIGGELSNDFENFAFRGRLLLIPSLDHQQYHHHHHPCHEKPPFTIGCPSQKNTLYCFGGRITVANKRHFDIDFYFGPF